MEILCIMLRWVVSESPCSSIPHWNRHDWRLIKMMNYYYLIWILNQNWLANNTKSKAILGYYQQGCYSVNGWSSTNQENQISEFIKWLCGIQILMLFRAGRKRQESSHVQLCGSINGCVICIVLKSCPYCGPAETQKVFIHAKIKQQSAMSPVSLHLFTPYMTCLLSLFYLSKLSYTVNSIQSKCSML